MFARLKVLTNQKAPNFIILNWQIRKITTKSEEMGREPTWPRRELSWCASIRALAWRCRRGCERSCFERRHGRELGASRTKIAGNECLIWRSGEIGRYLSGRGSTGRRRELETKRRERLSRCWRLVPPLPSGEWKVWAERASFITSLDSGLPGWW